MNNRKFSRTLEEAFGPGHRGGIYITPEPMILADKIIVGAFCAALCFFGIAFILG